MRGMVVKRQTGSRGGGRRRSQSLCSFVCIETIQTLHFEKFQTTWQPIKAFTCFVTRPGPTRRRALLYTLRGDNNNTMASQIQSKSRRHARRANGGSGGGGGGVRRGRKRNGDAALASQPSTKSSSIVSSQPSGAAASACGQLHVHRCRFVDVVPQGITALAFASSTPSSSSASARWLAVGRDSGDIEVWAYTTISLRSGRTSTSWQPTLVHCNTHVAEAPPPLL